LQIAGIPVSNLAPGFSGAKLHRRVPVNGRAKIAGWNLGIMLSH